MATKLPWMMQLVMNMLQTELQAVCLQILRHHLMVLKLTHMYVSLGMQLQATTALVTLMYTEVQRLTVSILLLRVSLLL